MGGIGSIEGVATTEQADTLVGFRPPDGPRVAWTEDDGEGGHAGCSWAVSSDAVSPGLTWEI